VVYHSHVLEHFSKKDGELLIKNCFRILKPGGIIRIAVPDLEGIAKLYLHNLDKAFNGDEPASLNYEWVMLELFDQMTREKPGGEMAECLGREALGNEEFVLSRLGTYGRDLIKQHRRKNKYKTMSGKKSRIPSVQSLIDSIRMCMLSKEEKKFLELGRFRASGEVHKWMYDRYSLKKLLEIAGFKDIRLVAAHQSTLPDWDKYGLDCTEGQIRKSDSLFIEATK